MSGSASKPRNYAPPAADVSEQIGKGRLIETPYSRARREHDGLLGLALSQARRCSIGLAVSAAITCVSLLGNLYLGSLPKVVPHIIEVDATGAATYRGPADKPLEPSERVTRYQLMQFIELVRTVTSDVPLYKERLLQARKMLTANGDILWREWGNATRPLELAKTQTTAVEIVSAVPLSKLSWQIDWQERTWDTRANPVGKPVMWRAMLKVVHNPPGSEKQILENPLGIYVDEFHWDRLLAVK